LGMAISVAEMRGAPHRQTMSFRSVRSTNPESRDSGSGPADHPGMTITTTRELQCSDVYAAPNIAPGFSRLPSWT
jgi:hypothetical protein